MAGLPAFLLPLPLLLSVSVLTEACSVLFLALCPPSAVSVVAAFSAVLCLLGQSAAVQLRPQRHWQYRPAATEEHEPEERLDKVNESGEDSYTTTEDALVTGGGAVSAVEATNDAGLHLHHCGVAPALSPFRLTVTAAPQLLSAAGVCLLGALRLRVLVVLLAAVSAGDVLVLHSLAVPLTALLSAMVGPAALISPHQLLPMGVAIGGFSLLHVDALAAAATAAAASMQWLPLPPGGQWLLFSACVLVLLSTLTTLSSPPPQLLQLPHLACSAAVNTLLALLLDGADSLLLPALLPLHSHGLGAGLACLALCGQFFSSAALRDRQVPPVERAWLPPLGGAVLIAATMAATPAGLQDGALTGLRLLAAVLVVAAALYSLRRPATDTTPSQAAASGAGQGKRAAFGWALLASAAVAVALPSSALLVVPLATRHSATPPSSLLLLPIPALSLHALSLPHPSRASAGAAGSRFPSLPSSSSPGSDSDGHWRSRLSVVRVEASEGMVGVLVNIAQLTGAAAFPPLFAGLPCVASAGTNESSPESTAAAAAAADGGSCSESPLWSADSGLMLLLSVYEQEGGEGQWKAVQRPSINVAVSASDLSSLARLPAQQQVLLQALTRLPSCRHSTSGESEEAGLRCPLPVVAHALQSLLQPFSVIAFVPGLSVGHSYSVAARLSNGSHLTAASFSAPFAMQPQLELFHAEQSAVTAHFDRLQRYRRPAPFEVAQSPSEDRCPAAFHEAVAEYRQWHRRQLARLQAAANTSVSALQALLTTDAEPVRLAISQVNPTSGLSDRTNGLLGLYTMAFLSRRVLLMDDDWPSLHLSLQSSLSLSLDAVAPFLRSAHLAELTMRRGSESWQGYNGGILDPPPVDDMDRFFPKPLSFVISIRGQQVRLLLYSKQYGPRLAQLGLTTDTVVGCFYHSLFVLRRSVWDSQSEYGSAAAALLQRDTRAVGLQIRTGRADREAAAQSVADSAALTLSTLAPVMHFFHCAHDISDSVRQEAQRSGRPVTTPWLLVTDDVDISSAALARWGEAGGALPAADVTANTTTTTRQGDKVDEEHSPSPRVINMQLPSLLGHTSHAGSSMQVLLFFRHSLVEQALFTLAEHHVISSVSGFGRLPAAISLRKRRVFTDSTSMCFDPAQHGRSIEELSREYSLLAVQHDDDYNDGQGQGRSRPSTS